jgi:hypothetical protein
MPERKSAVGRQSKSEKIYHAAEQFLQVNRALAYARNTSPVQFKINCLRKRFNNKLARLQKQQSPANGHKPIQQ